jgi:HSP20 family protein
MRLVRFNQPAVNQVFGNDFNNLFKTFETMLPNKISHSQYNTLPAVNVKEIENAFHIEVAAPGLKKEDFKLSLNESRLTISVNQEQKTEENTEKFIRKEFSFTSFQRTFNLPKNVEIEGIGATYTDGILTINVPKQEEVKPAIKEIAVV